MKCYACGDKALYRVGSQGFCKLHYGDAVAIRKSCQRAYSEAISAAKTDYQKRQRKPPTEAERRARAIKHEMAQKEAKS